MSATDALGIAVALTAPLTTNTEMLRDGCGRVDGVMREGLTRTRMETAVSGRSVVEPATCSTYDWTGLSVSVTFVGCTLDAVGAPMDGTLTLGVSFFPTAATLTFGGLTVGAATIDGVLALNVGGECGTDTLGCTACADTHTTCTATRAPQRTLSGQLTIQTGDTTRLSISSMTVSADATGATASGEATLATAGLAPTAVLATDLHWNVGECSPSSGTAGLPDSHTTLTFLATTPATGAVEVTVGPRSLGEQMLFPACSAP